MTGAPPPEVAGRRRRRRVVALATVTALVIVASSVWWVFTGLPRPLATALAEAEWAPCGAAYDSARTARDTARVDSRVIRPRSRFTPAVTCGTRRTSLP